MDELVGGIYYDVTADTSKLVGQTRVVERETQTMAASFNRITQAVKIYAAALALVKSAQMADDLRLLSARVQVAAGSFEAGAAAMDELRKISQRTQTELAANASVFGRLNQSILQMGGNQSDTLRITELLGKAIKVSGASGVEAASAMTQFGQALGSGKLAGDELRSLLENAPYLMQQLAAGIGVPIGALKQLGEDGKLTADVVTNALSKAAEKIEADFQRMPQTLSGAMSLVRDAAAQANEKLDTLTGTSDALTGASKGLAEVLQRLADQFGAANEQAGTLGRNGAVKTWADATRTALSYVVDAADMTWQALSVLGRNVAFVFTSVGAEIGGIGAQIAAVARGDLAGAVAIGEAMKADSAKRRAELDASDAKTLANRKLFGQQMREAAEQGAGGGRGFVNPSGAASTLKSPGGTGGGKKDKFDDAAYLAGLAKQTAEGLDLVNMIEQEALRKNAQMLQEGKITRQTAATAATLIEQNAVHDRRDIILRDAEERRALIEKQGMDEVALAKRLAEERVRGQQFASSILGQGDEVLRLQMELQAKSDLLVTYAQQDQANEVLYAQARVALEQQTQDQIAAIAAKRQTDSLAAQSQMLQGYGALFGSMSEITKGFAGEQSGAYKAMFAVSKAFAIADSIIKIQQGISNALSLPYPANIAAAASTAAAAAGILSTIKGTNFGGGRQYGGPVSAGSMYRVNEGGLPEMFTAANGSQYMMPTASGKVTPANGIGGGVVININNTMAGAQVTASSRDDGRVVDIAVRQAIAETAGQISEHRGPVWSALRGTTNVSPKL